MQQNHPEIKGHHPKELHLQIYTNEHKNTKSRKKIIADKIEKYHLSYIPWLKGVGLIKSFHWHFILTMKAIQMDNKKCSTMRNP